MAIKTGGPAFPASGHPGQQFIQQEGMTLRDYFAAKAMQAFITGSMSDGTAFSAANNDQAIAAGVAYLVADAMLKAREES